MNSIYIPNYDFLEPTSEKVSGAVKSLLSEDQLCIGSNIPKGWIDAPLKSVHRLEYWKELVKSLVLPETQYQYIIGMGGSVLGASALMENPFTQSELKTYYLDSNHPCFIDDIVANMDFSTSMFVVCSKSGTTKETLSLFSFFLNRCIDQLGVDEAMRRFVSVTDPNSPLQDVSDDMGISVVHSDPDIGGRFSILSSLSIIPSLMSGVDLTEIIHGAERAMNGCLRTELNAEIEYRVPSLLNWLKDDRDKLSIYVPRSLESFGLWLVQLIAESLGKNQLGFIPVLRYLDCETDIEPYDDECCLIINDGSIIQGINSSADNKSARNISSVMEIDIYDSGKLGQEFYYWEFSVALIGLMLKINPFDQPDVELSKSIFKKMEFQDVSDIPSCPDLGKEVFEEINARVEFGKYIAILAYLNPSDIYRETFEILRYQLESFCCVPVILDFGPRYLHSTGQLYKGGPESGLFIQILEEGYPHQLKSKELIESYAQMVWQAQSDYEAMEKLGIFVFRRSIPFDDLEPVQNLINEMSDFS